MFFFGFIVKQSGCFATVSHLAIKMTDVKMLSDVIQCFGLSKQRMWADVSRCEQMRVHDILEEQMRLNAILSNNS